MRKAQKKSKAKPKPVFEQRRDFDLFSKAFTEADVVRTIWDEASFRHWMHEYKTLEQKKRSMRQAVLWKTLQLLAIQPEQSEKRMRKAGDDTSIGQVTILGNDSLDCALWLRERGLVPNVLVFASRSHLGGGYLQGSKAQEEDIYRRSAISTRHEPGETLPLELSFLQNLGVCVLRGSEKYGYPVLQRRQCVNMFSMQGICNPSIETLPDGRERMDKASAKLLSKKLEVCLTEMVGDALVLGAWGCGVYKCPAEHVAEIMRDSIRAKSTTSQIFISIPEDTKKSKRNLMTFASVFKEHRIGRAVPLYQRIMACTTFLILWKRGTWPILGKEVATTIAKQIQFDDSIVYDIENV